MLDEAFDILGGVQQTPHWSRKKGEPTFEEGSADVDMIARKIYTKLTGKKINCRQTSPLKTAKYTHRPEKPKAATS